MIAAIPMEKFKAINEQRRRVVVIDDSDSDRQKSLGKNTRKKKSTAGPVPGRNLNYPFPSGSIWDGSIWDFASRPTTQPTKHVHDRVSSSGPCTPTPVVLDNPIPRNDTDRSPELFGMLDHVAKDTDDIQAPEEFVQLFLPAYHSIDQVVPPLKTWLDFKNFTKEQVNPRVTMHFILTKQIEHHKVLTRQGYFERKDSRPRTQAESFHQMQLQALRQEQAQQPARKSQQAQQSQRLQSRPRSEDVPVQPGILGAKPIRADTQRVGYQQTYDLKPPPFIPTPMPQLSLSKMRPGLQYINPPPGQAYRSSSLQDFNRKMSGQTLAPAFPKPRLVSAPASTVQMFGLDVRPTKTARRDPAVIPSRHYSGLRQASTRTSSYQTETGSPLKTLTLDEVQGMGRKDVGEDAAGNFYASPYGRYYAKAAEESEGGDHKAGEKDSSPVVVSSDVGAAEIRSSPGRALSVKEMLS